MRFEFNDRGVCQNPERKVDLHDGKNYLIVKVAQLPDGSWAEGLDMRVGTLGYLYSPSMGRERYDSDRSAAYAVLLKVKETLEREIQFWEKHTELDDNLEPVDNSKAMQGFRRMLKVVLEKLEYYDPVQMTLF